MTRSDRSAVPHPSEEILQLFGLRHREEFTPGDEAEHALARDIAFFAKLHEIEKQGAGNAGPQIAPHVKIGLEAAGVALKLKTKRVLVPARDPVINIGAKVETLSVLFVADLDPHRGEPPAFHDNPAFLDGCHKEVLV